MKSQDVHRYLFSLQRYQDADCPSYFLRGLNEKRKNRTCGANEQRKGCFASEDTSAGRECWWTDQGVAEKEENSSGGGGLACPRSCMDVSRKIRVHSLRNCTTGDQKDEDAGAQDDDDHRMRAWEGRHRQSLVSQNRQQNEHLRLSFGAFASDSGADDRHSRDTWN